MTFISGKVALITGGASGLGFAYARELLRNDLRAVTLADINPISGKDAVATLTKEFGPGRVLYVKTDVTVKEEIEEAFEKTIAAFKNLDLIINNAGVMNDAIWERQIAINLTATVAVCLLGMEKYIPKYKTGDEGVILNVSSVAGLSSGSSLPVYVATKHGVVGLSRSFGEHYARTKVRIITFCPGVTITPLITDSSHRNLGEPYEKLLMEALTRMLPQKPEVVAKAVVKVIEEGESASTWVVEDSVLTRVQLPDHHTLIKASRHGSHKL